MLCVSKKGTSMLTIQTTENLSGIRLQGDYNDLNSIYDALSRYLDFYQEHAIGYPYHEYEYLLSLNYDIRHAYQGSREHVVVENNAENYCSSIDAMYELGDDFEKVINKVHKDFRHGNLYYEVKILYPLVFHYLASLSRILDDYYELSWFDSEGKEHSPFPPYNELQANHDRAQIQLFTSLLWDNVNDLLGEETALEVFRYYSDQEFGFTSSLYIDALLQHMQVNFDAFSEDKKREYLYLSLMEILDTTDLTESPEEFPACYACYKATLNSFPDSTNQASASSDAASARIKKEFPTQKSFLRKFNAFTEQKKPLYRNDFDQFLTDLYGEADDDSPTW